MAAGLKSGNFHSHAIGPVGDSTSGRQYRNSQAFRAHSDESIPWLRFD